jgi:hypothetical protein
MLVRGRLCLCVSGGGGGKALFSRSGGCLFMAPGLNCCSMLKEPARKPVQTMEGGGQQ